MESSNNTNITPSNSRFNVVIRIRPQLGDESNELTTDQDLFICTKKLNEKEIQLTKPMNEEITII